MKSRDIAALQAALGYHFIRPELLAQALTHTSQARELEASQPLAGGRVGDNEQLEFLGDSVLALVTSEELFHRFPHFREGELSKLRAHLVSERHLIRVAQQLELGHYLRLGRGEEKSGGRNKTALLVDALEAVLAAIYLDSGLQTARHLILQYIVAPELERIARHGEGLPVTDYKSALQERMQALGRPQPSYLLVKEQGPEHSKIFTIEVRLQAPDASAKAEFVGRAEGSTKKNAEQDAARQALEYLAALPADSNGQGKAKGARVVRS
ncbi:MAG TPA: ribonuclease III [Terriglobales bacterium]|jgi:ribonuclease-3|nr:ribonuclease III [Terriglobales bacterium]